MERRGLDKTKAPSVSGGALGLKSRSVQDQRAQTLRPREGVVVVVRAVRAIRMRQGYAGAVRAVNADRPGGPREGVLSRHGAAMKRFLSTPMPVISTSTSSPAFRSGDVPSVPIQIMSPG